MTAPAAPTFAKTRVTRLPLGGTPAPATPCSELNRIWSTASNDALAYTFRDSVSLYSWPVFHDSLLLRRRDPWPPQAAPIDAQTVDGRGFGRDMWQSMCRVRKEPEDLCLRELALHQG